MSSKQEDLTCWDWIIAFIVALCMLSLFMGLVLK